MPSDDVEQAFTRAFEAYGAELRAYAQRFVRSRHAAEDVVQNVFLRVWDLWTQLDLTELRAYLYRATRNRALNYRRDESLAARQAMRIDDSPLVELPENDARLWSEDIARAVGQVVRAMPPRRQLVVTLRLRDNLSHAEIAAQLGITQKGVERQMTFALRTLRKRLPGLLGEER